MSRPGPPRPPRPDILRRRVRQPATITLPVLRERPEAPHQGRHAQMFISGLMMVVLTGAVLLASPWTTESGEATPPVDALFTAVSAAAVTGLVTVDTAAHWNFLGELIILILIQAGGLGFMVGASIVLQALRRGATRLSDVLLVKEGGPSVSMQEAMLLTRRIIVFTFAVEAIGATFLTMRFWRDMPFLDALWFGIFHAISAFCNAGFDLQGGYVSLVPYQDSLVTNGVLILLIQTGALSYIVLSDTAVCRRWSPLSLDSKLVLTVNGVLLVVGTALFLSTEWSRSLESTAVGMRPLVALFQSVAARTAGFATVSFGEVHHITLFLWIALMMIGGASGSTAGGVKLATIGVVAAAVVSTLRGQEETQLFGRRVPTPHVFRAMAVIAIMLVVHFTATVLLALTEELSSSNEFGFITLMFETMSALATVGLSTGITPSLTTAGKLVLCAAMFFGRLGPLTVAYALQRRQRVAPYRFAPTTVRIG